MESLRAEGRNARFLTVGARPRNPKIRIGGVILHSFGDGKPSGKHLSLGSCDVSHKPTGCYRHFLPRSPTVANGVWRCGSPQVKHRQTPRSNLGGKHSHPADAHAPKRLSRLPGNTRGKSIAAEGAEVAEEEKARSCERILILLSSSASLSDLSGYLTHRSWHSFRRGLGNSWPADPACGRGYALRSTLHGVGRRPCSPIGCWLVAIGFGSAPLRGACLMRRDWVSSSKRHGQDARVTHGRDARATW